MMQGYYGIPEETAAALRDGWLHTGDLGPLDADGYLHFAGRKKDAIRRRGENISAFEVEEVVNAHPDVAECGRRRRAQRADRGGRQDLRRAARRRGPRPGRGCARIAPSAWRAS